MAVLKTCLHQKLRSSRSAKVRIVFFALWIFILSEACLSDSAHADLDASMPSQLSLEAVFAMVTKDNPTLGKANSKINEMTDAKYLALSNYIPAIGLQSTLSSNEIVLSQKIYDGGASLASIDLAERRKQIAEIEKEMQTEKVHNQVIDAYYEAIFSLQKKRYFESNGFAIAEGLAKAEKQFKYRVIGHDAILRARVEFRKNRSEAFEAQNSEREAIRILAHLTRRSDFSAEWLSNSIDPDRLPEPFSEKPSSENENAFSSRPEVEFLRANGKALDAEKNFELAVDRPNISFLASYGLGQQAPSMSVNYVYAVGLQYGFSLTIPFTSAFSSYARKKVFAERQIQLEHDIHNMHDDFDFEEREKMALLNQDWQDLLAIREELVASEEILREANANFKIGLSSPEVWFEATDNVRQWKIRQLEKAKSYLIRYQYLKEIAQRMPADVK